MNYDDEAPMRANNVRIYHLGPDSLFDKSGFGRISPETVVYGECGSSGITPSLDVESISHSVTNIRVEGEWVLGDFTILNTPSGDVLKELIEANIETYCSIGGVGKMVGGRSTDFTLTSISMVEHPVNEDCYIDLTSARTHDEGEVNRL